MINPRGVKIVANTGGFFIANDAEEVRRANAFCKVRKRAKFVVVFAGFAGGAGNFMDKYHTVQSIFIKLRSKLTVHTTSVQLTIV
jgi:hypothetical protein